MKNLMIRLARIFLTRSGIYSGRFLKTWKKQSLSPEWQQRIQDVISSPDNAYIPRVQNAGHLVNGAQVMHNGLKIMFGSCYGAPGIELLLRNKGVHEPQEERVFNEVLSHIPDNAVMLELGAYWSFYSMWFYSRVSNAKCFMIEPDIVAYNFGKANFRLNKMKGDFTNAFISSTSFTKNGERTICIDDFVKERNIHHIHILHSDIQGFEYEMLQGAEGCFRDSKISYVFISTHSNEIHQQCLYFLKKFEFNIIAAADLKETYSVDGLIAARAPFVNEPEQVIISLKKSY